MNDILNLTFKDMKNVLLDHGIPANRAYPIWGWIYRQSEFDFENMSDLPKIMRPQLKEHFRIISLDLKNIVTSGNKESIKFLFETHDGFPIESVLLLSSNYHRDMPDRRTVCVSTQIGCPLSCSFCATGKMQFERNLEVHEIISQVLLVDQYCKELLGFEKKSRALTNVVFMGMGEPLLNYENVMRSIHVLNFSGGFNLGMRHFTISTAGLPEMIRSLAEDNPQIRLAVSLNSANQDKRKLIMPIAKKHSVHQLLDAIKYYQVLTNRRVTFEYILIPGINDEEEDIINLKRTVHGIKYNLNLIPFNPVNDIVFDRPSKKKMNDFKQLLEHHSIPYVERYSKGDEISAGCGQLGASFIKKGI